LAHKCVVKGCDRNATVGGIVVGTKDVLLELCDYHSKQFEMTKKA
jgi:hypothetical protein